MESRLVSRSYEEQGQEGLEKGWPQEIQLPLQKECTLGFCSPTLYKNTFIHVDKIFFHEVPILTSLSQETEQQNNFCPQGIFSWPPCNVTHVDVQ